LQKFNFLFFLLISSLFSREIYKEIRLVIEDGNTIEVLQSEHLGIDHFHITDDWIQFVIPSQKIIELEQKSLDFSIVHEDIESYYASRLDNTYEARDFELGSMGGYYTFAEIEEQLDKLFLEYPTIITEKVSLGLTLEGRDIWMVKVSDNPELDEDEPEVLYTGLHHSREPMSYMNLFYFIHWLGENYNVDPEATALVNGREMYFIPAINPDGLVYNQQIAPNGGGMQRKNMRDSCLGTPTGVDLNRNYSYMWGYDNQGSSPDGCNETYRGTLPFSEPETQVVKSFVESRDFKIALNYHSYSNLLIYPFGYDPDIPVPDEDFEIFVEYGEIMTQYNGYLLGTGIETVGYTVNGEACDWMYGEKDIFAYTPEIGSFNDGFWPATNRIIPLAEENLFPNKFVAWSVGSHYNLDFSIESGDYLQGQIYSTELSISNAGLSSSTGPISLYIDSEYDFINFDIPTIELDEIPARSTIDLGDIFSFQITASAPSGTMAEINLRLIDENGFEYIEVLQLIIGASVDLITYDFENDSDWTIGAMDDDANAGIWEVGIPQATYFENNQAQPGSDISEDGQKCFITGAATSPGSVGFDDVDGGKTTLLSPSFDLSDHDEVLVSYWRWYTNNVGDNPGTDHFYVDVTNDNGENWFSLEYTNQSQAEWIKKQFFLSDLGLDISNNPIQFRFIAEDIFNTGDSGTGGSIIEAAIDDFRIITFESSIDNCENLGDLNYDGILNILDIVSLVSCIVDANCGTNSFACVADLNSDLGYNVLDVVLLVNLILN